MTICWQKEIASLNALNKYKQVSTTRTELLQSESLNFRSCNRLWRLLDEKRRQRAQPTKQVLGKQQQLTEVATRGQTHQRSL